MVFCKSKAKYHMLCRPPISQAAPGRREGAAWSQSRERAGASLHRSLKYLMYDNAPAKLFISGGGEGEPNRPNSEEAQDLQNSRSQMRPSPSLFSQNLGKKKTHEHSLFQASSPQGTTSQSPLFKRVGLPGLRRGSWTQGPPGGHPHSPGLADPHPPRPGRPAP